MFLSQLAFFLLCCHFSQRTVDLSWIILPFFFTKYEAFPHHSGKYVLIKRKKMCTNWKCDKKKWTNDQHEMDMFVMHWLCRLYKKNSIANINKQTWLIVLMILEEQLCSLCKTSYFFVPLAHSLIYISRAHIWTKAGSKGECLSCFLLLWDVTKDHWHLLNAMQQTC